VFTQLANELRSRSSLKKEIIIAAGTLASPQNQSDELMGLSHTIMLQTLSNKLSSKL
jgi:hypothetical protein